MTAVTPWGKSEAGQMATGKATRYEQMKSISKPRSCHRGNQLINQA
ncbi:hypothetical protein PsAD13_04977 [Pseudovibrio sp. Ad13]|nr:hypothetical protein PsAD13_04977 [Pseudovibrio sp. Ad13]